MADYHLKAIKHWSCQCYLMCKSKFVLNKNLILVPLVCVLFDFISLEKLTAIPFLVAAAWFSDTVNLIISKKIYTFMSLIFLSYLFLRHNSVYPFPCPLRSPRSHSHRKQNCKKRKWQQYKPYWTSSKIINLESLVIFSSLHSSF